MKRTFALKIPFLVAVLLFYGYMGFALESFRVTQAHIARIDPVQLEAVTVSIGYNDGIAVILPEDRTFLKALEIEIRSPDLAIQFPGSMAYALYTDISHLPDGKTIDFSGEKILMEILPSRVAFAFRIPLRDNHGLKSDPYTEVLAEVLPAESFPLFFRLFPIMKGLPDDFETASFSVKVKPVLADEGGLLLSIAYPEQGAGQLHEPVSLSVRIDEKAVPEPEKMQILSHGEHLLAVSAEKYRTEIRTFTIERARITGITIEMKDTAPTVTFVSPDNVKIAFDGEIVADPRGTMKIEPGRHTVTFFVGDYSLQRQFTAEEGRDYSVSMTMDAEIIELR